MKDSEALDNLWKHAGREKDQESSPCLAEIKTAIGCFLSENTLRPLREIASRIEGNSLDFERYGTAYIRVANGEWIITDDIMSTWGLIRFFGKRDYFPDRWHVIDSEIGNALRSARKWQTLQRYKKNGGLGVEHRKLLSRLIWDMDSFRDDWVSLYVQGKRPFGNSSIDFDMLEILGWPFPGEDENIPPETTERLWQLFDELQFAVIDALNFSET